VTKKDPTMAIRARIAAAKAGNSWGGRKVNCTVEVPAGTGSSWNSPWAPNGSFWTATGFPLTLADQPGMSSTCLRSTEGRVQVTVA
jgi:hypothetical protein